MSSLSLATFPSLLQSPLVPNPIPCASLSSFSSSSATETQHRLNLVSRNDRLVLAKEDPNPDSDLRSRKTKLVVRALLNSARASKRFDLFKTLDEYGPSWSLSEFNHILSALLGADEPGLATDLFSGISSLGLLPDSRTFSIIIRCHCEKNELGEAERVLAHAVGLGKGLEPDVESMTDLIHGFCQKGKLQKAFEVLEVMGKIGCEPTILTYNCLIKGLCLVGRVEEAADMLISIKRLSLRPDIYSYTAVMDGLCKVGRSTEAMELLTEALEMKLTPSVATFNTLLQGYCKRGRPVEGIQVLRRMKEINCSPDRITYTTCLHGLLKWGQFRAAVSIYEEMEEAGFKAGRGMMNRLLRDLCRASWKEQKVFKDAYWVFVKLKNRANVIESRTYFMVIQMLCIRRKTDEAFLHLQEMIEAGYKPRMVAVDLVIEALCLEGKIDKALRVLLLMNECERVPSELTYSLLIAEFNRQGLLLGACSIFGAALKQGKIPQRKPQC